MFVSFLLLWLAPADCRAQSTHDGKSLDRVTWSPLRTALPQDSHVASPAAIVRALYRTASTGTGYARCFFRMPR